MNTPTLNPLFLTPTDVTNDWQAKQLYVPRQLIIKVIGENVSEHNPRLATAMTTLLEIHPISVSGFTNDFNRLDANSICKEDINFSLNPFFFFNEKFGKVVSSTVMRFHALQQQENIKFDIIAIEPDSTGTQVVDAWLCENIRIEHFCGPETIRTVEKQERSNGPISCFIKIGSAAAHLNFCYKKDGSNPVLEKAQEVLKSLNVESANPGPVDSTMDFINRMVGSEEEK